MSMELIGLINGQKKIIPLTADAGAGAPVGTIIAMYKKSSPSGYLYCDGSTFDQTAYPLLYAYLGSNVLPDYREFALVGAEENTTDVYNASTNPNGTIHDHDVYTEGQAKDDQLQNHTHSISGHFNDGTEIYARIRSVAHDWGTNTGNVNSGRHGTVTRGKRKAVYFYIKATSGLSENAQDNVLAQLNEQRSYSTEEHLTGRKWIDGKPTYEKTIDCGALPNNTTKSVAHNIQNIDFVIKAEIKAKAPSVNTYVVFSYGGNRNVSVSNDVININTDWNMSHFTESYITLEYTKTTDV